MAQVSRETPKQQREKQLAADLSLFYDDPLGHVLYSYPWDTDQEIQMVAMPKHWQDVYQCEYGPDGWAIDFLNEIGEEVKKRGFDGRKAVMPIHFSTVSGHGIGKSVICAWIIKWIMDTRPFCRGKVTSGKAEQLRTNTWAELGKWHAKSPTRDWFKWNTGRGAMSMQHVKFGTKWICEATTAKEENRDSFAGLHAANSTPFYLFDEASAIPDGIYEVREGGATDGEPMRFDFGNGTRNSGRFYEQHEGKYKAFVINKSIDSRSVSITNKEQIAQWAEIYGENSDFFKVRVRGMFPSQGSIQFIGSGIVSEAMQREVVKLPLGAQPLVIGVDVARFGDNESIIYPRIGDDARTYPFKRFRGLDTVQLTGKIIEEVRWFRNMGMPCRGLFVDGTGIGGAVVDQLKHAGFDPIEVVFNSKPTDDRTYRFKCDEMWGEMRDHIQRRLVLPGITDPGGNDLREQLTAREFGYTLSGNKIFLEPKEDMADRLKSENSSPDIADALALTYARPVAPIDQKNNLSAPQKYNHEYDPLA